MPATWPTALREELEDLDEEEFLPVGTAGFADGDLLLEHDQNDGFRVKNDEEEVLGEVTEEQLRRLEEDDASGVGIHRNPRIFWRIRQGTPSEILF